MRSVAWLSVAVISVQLVPVVHAAEPTAGEIAAAGRTFRKTCFHCHQVPDLRFGTDLVWLDQLHRTA
jgi:hypothetical protein